MTINSLTYHRRNTSAPETYLSVLSWLIEQKEEQYRLTMTQPNGSLWLDFDSSDHRTVGAWGVPVSLRAIVVRFSTDGTVTLYPRRVLRCTNPSSPSEYNYSTRISGKAYRCLPTNLAYTSSEGNHIEVHAWYLIDHGDPQDRPGYYAPIRAAKNGTHFTHDAQLIGWTFHGDAPPPYTIDWSKYPDVDYPDAFYARHSYCHPWTLPYTIY